MVMKIISPRSRQPGTDHHNAHNDHDDHDDSDDDDDDRDNDHNNSEYVDDPGSPVLISDQ